MVWYGMVWYGMVWCGAVRFMRRGTVYYGIWHDMVWYSMTYGAVSHYRCIRHGIWYAYAGDMAHSKGWHGMAWHGVYSVHLCVESHRTASLVTGALSLVA